MKMRANRQENRNQIAPLNETTMASAILIATSTIQPVNAHRGST
jgi:hypothetical protein